LPPPGFPNSIPPRRRPRRPRRPADSAFPLVRPRPIGAVSARRAPASAARAVGLGRVLREAIPPPDSSGSGCGANALRPFPPPAFPNAASGFHGKLPSSE